MHEQTIKATIEGLEFEADVTEEAADEGTGIYGGIGVGGIRFRGVEISDIVADWVVDKLIAHYWIESRHLRECDDWRVEQYRAPEAISGWVVQILGEDK